MLLLQGSTQHRRFQPRSHHFQYPLIYAQIKVTKDAAVSQVHRLDAAGLLQIREVDYLPVQDHPGNLHERLLFLIQEKARVSLSSESAADWEIWLVTMPRWFGYAFNPVSVYFCWNEKKEWKWAVLEVGNTFGERLPYILSVNEASDSKRPKYESHYIWEFLYWAKFIISLVSISVGLFNDSFMYRHLTIAVVGMKFI